jgi:DNA phosphorothioation-associated putative methyltransferase
VLTRLGTFQKFYSQGELREYLQTELGLDAIAAAPGVFYLFKDEALQQQFLAGRYRRRAAAPRKRVSELRFEEHRELLERLMAAITDLGRLPEVDEFDGAEAVTAEFGSLKRAFALIRRVTGTEEWEQIRRRRIEDLLVYLALARFRKRPPISKLPRGLQRDVREFFGTYKRACEQADELLFRAGEAEAIDEACRRAPIGKLLPTALYLHKSAIDTLEPLLRIYEGCARSYLGEIEDANLVKLHRFTGKVSYLAYPDFENDPHPRLVRSVKLNLRTLELDCWDYSTSDNPPILHRKETFLPLDHPLYDKFARLTRQEERQGLLDDTATIGTHAGWEARLRQHGVTLRGHRLVHRQTAPETPES